MRSFCEKPALAPPTSRRQSFRIGNPVETKLFHFRRIKRIYCPQRHQIRAKILDHQALLSALSRSCSPFVMSSSRKSCTCGDGKNVFHHVCRFLTTNYSRSLRLSPEHQASVEHKRDRPLSYSLASQRLHLGDPVRVVNPHVRAGKSTSCTLSANPETQFTAKRAIVSAQIHSRIKYSILARCVCGALTKTCLHK